MQHIPEKIDSKFRFILVAAHRAEQLIKGARPRVEAQPDAKPTRLAMQEVEKDLIDWDYGPEPVEEPAVVEAEPADTEVH
jgi:DNA-directed RNA polymerase omega subunit